MSLVDVMLVKTLGYNLLSVHALGKMGFAIFIDNDIVILLWSKTLKVAFVGYVENDLYVVDFSGKTTTGAICLISGIFTLIYHLFYIILLVYHCCFASKA